MLVFKLLYNGKGKSYQRISDNNLHLVSKPNWSAVAYLPLRLNKKLTVDFMFKVNYQKKCVYPYPAGGVALYNPKIKPWGEKFGELIFENDESGLINLDQETIVKSLNKLKQRTIKSLGLPYKKGVWYKVRLFYDLLKNNLIININGLHFTKKIITGKLKPTGLAFMSGNCSEVSIDYKNITIN